MTTTVSDLVEQASLTLGDQGFVLRRVFKVFGVEGNADAKAFNAINAQGIPSRWDFSNAIPNLRVDTKEATPIGSGADWLVICTYKFVPNSMVLDAPPEFEIGATIQEAETNLDYAGNPIEVSYTPLANDPDGNLIAGKEDTQNPKVQFATGMVVMRGTRKELGSPYAKAKLFVDKINSVPFQGDPPFFWRCTGITGRLDKDGYFLVTYEFQRNPYTWNPLVSYTLASTGVPPGEDSPGGPLVEGIGYKYVQLQEGIDFSPLNLGDFGA